MTESELKDLFSAKLDKADVVNKLGGLITDGLEQRVAAAYKFAAAGCLAGEGKLAQFGVNTRAELRLLIDEVEDAFRAFSEKAES